MARLVELKCQTCQIPFMPVSEKNVFCSRKCFKKAFYHRQKAKELEACKFPIFTCPSCGEKIELDFDPVKENYKWLRFTCPKCSVLMVNVSENIVAVDESVT